MKGKKMLSKQTVSLRKAFAKVKAVKVKCTVTLANGEEKSTVATIGYNKINQLSGNGLTGKSLYDLAKKGRCETEVEGVKFVYQIVIDEPAAEYTPSVELVQAAENATIINTPKESENGETETIV